MLLRYVVESCMLLPLPFRRPMFYNEGQQQPSGPGRFAVASSERRKNSHGQVLAMSGQHAPGESLSPACGIGTCWVVAYRRGVERAELYYVMSRGARQRE